MEVGGLFTLVLLSRVLIATSLTRLEPVDLHQLIAPQDGGPVHDFVQAVDRDEALQNIIFGAGEIGDGDKLEDEETGTSLFGDVAAQYVDHTVGPVDFGVGERGTSGPGFGRRGSSGAGFYGPGSGGSVAEGSENTGSGDLPSGHDVIEADTAKVEDGGNSEGTAVKGNRDNRKGQATVDEKEALGELQPVSFRPCPGGGPAPTSLYVNCTSRVRDVCSLARGRSHTLVVTFTPVTTINHAVVSLLSWRTWLEMPLLGQDANACDHMTCPLHAGTKTTLDYRLNIPDVVGEKRDTLVWRLFDKQSRERLLCFTFRTHVT
ncbi:uncharacterized protein LOC108680261 [Hyalella azteca]|uniref:Uncharacterized protein LOC108680261 n=1 Tax=Hyalella azteca TaxID=294128 RepID=A0A8B7PEW3_HYAAZ|nr:uncharacterized protein LOC108680261 [Hyalella azteca]